LLRRLAFVGLATFVIAQFKLRAMPVLKLRQADAFIKCTAIASCQLDKFRLP